MKRVPLVIFGAGKVGRALVRQLVESAAYHVEHHRLELRVVAWCDRIGAVLDEQGLGPEALRTLDAAKAAGTPLAASPLGYQQDDPAAIVDVAGRDGCIVVDVTGGGPPTSGGAPTLPALELALRRGYAAVTANKAPLAGPQADFDRLTGRLCPPGRGRIGGRLRYETTVGSAVPVIEAALGLMRAADRVDRVQAALSGTLGFICTGLQAGGPFSALVAEAVRRGYTEPDPRIDLGGIDVARKALILARTLGWKMELGDVAVGSLVPAELTGLPPADFMARLGELDAGFAGRVAASGAEGKVLRYVAELADGRASVGLQAVPADSALGCLRGNDNLVAFHTRYYPETPLVLQGRGAGVEAAAAGVHADIVALASLGS